MSSDCRRPTTRRCRAHVTSWPNRRMKRLTGLSLAALVASALSGCGDTAGAPMYTGPAVEEVLVSPPALTIAVRGTIQLAASVQLALGNTNRTVTWSSSDSAVARVDQTGTVTGLKVGTVTVVARSNGNPAISGAATVSVNGSGFTSAVMIGSINAQYCTSGGGCTWGLANLDSIAGQIDVILNATTDSAVIKAHRSRIERLRCTWNTRPSWREPEESSVTASIAPSLRDF